MSDTDEVLALKAQLAAMSMRIQEVTVAAEQRIQEVTVAAEERFQEVSAEMRLVKRKSRLSELLSAETKKIPQIAHDANKSLSSKSKPLNGFAYNASWKDCLISYPQDSSEDEICKYVMEQMKDSTIPTTDVYYERETWHPIVRQVVNLIIQICNERRIPVLKSYYETNAKDGSDQNRPDFAFTLQTEQRRLHVNTCLILEVKGLKRANISRSVLLREGVAQAIRYLVRQQEECSDLNTCGIAIVASGARWIVVVHINFKDNAVPVTVSSELDLFKHDESGKIELQMQVPDGLRALVRLLLANDAGLFGLAIKKFRPQGLYEVKEILGVGGFSTVMRVVSSATNTVMACKWLRHPDLKVLEHESNILVELAEKNVPNIPRVCTSEGENGIIRNADNTQHGLLVLPVGKPCKEALIASSNKIDFAVRVYQDVWQTLQAAHAENYAHGDVRPSNIIETISEENGTSVFVLIDWGLAQNFAKKNEHKEIYGVASFMSDRRLNIYLSRVKEDPGLDANDDNEAAVLTFLALVSSPDGQPPWHDLTLSYIGYAKCRTEWFSDNATSLLESASHITLKDARYAVINYIESASAKLKELP